MQKSDVRRCEFTASPRCESEARPTNKECKAWPQKAWHVLRYVLFYPKYSPCRYPRQSLVQRSRKIHRSGRRLGIWYTDLPYYNSGSRRISYFVTLGLSSNSESAIGDNLSNTHRKTYGHKGLVLAEDGRLVVQDRLLENTTKVRLRPVREDDQPELTIVYIYPGPRSRWGSMTMRGRRNPVFFLVFFGEKLTGWAVDRHDAFGQSIRRIDAVTW